jgi:hypothetical protein
MGVEPTTKSCLLFSQARRASEMLIKGFELNCAKPSRFQTYHLNHLATVSADNIVHPVEFEPTRTNIFELELNPLDIITMQTRTHISSWRVR